MADMPFYQYFSGEEGEYGSNENENTEENDNEFNSRAFDEKLTATQKLEKYVLSEITTNREMIARSLLLAAHDTNNNTADFERFLRNVELLSKDLESSVRCILMEQIPHVMAHSHEQGQPMIDMCRSSLLPILAMYLHDTHNQVRKMSQAALMVLLEQKLLSAYDIEERICPAVTSMALAENLDDFRTEAVMLMCKMCPFVGQEIAERHLMMKFAEACSDSLFHVRKVCGSLFGEMCTVVGRESTEKHLLPKFLFLCEDGVWGVRKACTECFMQVSSVCSPEIRRTQLAQLFISLLCDQTRWVRMAAFQALGGFISTFADEKITGLHLNDQGELVYGNPAAFTVSSQPLLDGEEENSSDDEKKGKEVVSESEKAEESLSTSSSEINEEKHDDTSPCEMSTETQGETECSGRLATIGDHLEASDDERRAQYYCAAFGGGNGGLLAAERNCSEGDDEIHNGVDGGGGGVELSLDGGISLEKNGNLRTECESEYSSEENERNIDEERTVEQMAADSESIDAFNEFQYWRPPLPTVGTAEESKSVDVAEALICDAGQTHELLKHQSAFDTNVNLESDVTTESREEREKMGDEEGKISDSLILEGSSVNDGSIAAKEGSGIWKDSLAAKVKVPPKVPTSLSGLTVNTGDAMARSLSVPKKGDTLLTICTSIVKELEKEDAASSSSTNNVREGGMDRFSYYPFEKCTISTTEQEEDEESISSCDQDVVPQSLLDHFKSMVDPTRSQSVDMEISRHCAYNIPAVAYTLGRKNWPCLKELYETLASDMQWKVRRTLAFSIHEVALIVGDEITHKHLVPIFNGFLKDLDEVRVGVLKHLADFLRLLRADIRREYLTKIPDFLSTDNLRNWRFRKELAKQLLKMLELFECDDINAHLLPLTLTLVDDKVADVRMKAFRVLSGIVNCFASSPGDSQLLRPLLADFVQRFAKNERWSRRQMFVHICQCILEDRCLAPDWFVSELLMPLLQLRDDHVANVRFSLAKILSQHILISEYFNGEQNAHREALLDVARNLSSDRDRDVRYLMTLSQQTQSNDDSSIAA